MAIPRIDVMAMFAGPIDPGSVGVQMTQDEEQLMGMVISEHARASKAQQACQEILSVLERMPTLERKAWPLNNHLNEIEAYAKAGLED